MNLDTSCANLDPGISSHCSSPDLSPSSRKFADLTLVNWRRPWGSRRLDFIIRVGSFKFFVDKISKFCDCGQQPGRHPLFGSSSSAAPSSTRAVALVVPISMVQSNRQNWMPSSFINHRPTGGITSKDRRQTILLLASHVPVLGQVDEIQICWGFLCAANQLGSLFVRVRNYSAWASEKRKRSSTRIKSMRLQINRSVQSTRRQKITSRKNYQQYPPAVTPALVQAKV
jgi:hypothetical protein